MSSHVNYCICLKHFFQVGIKGCKAMMRRAAFRHHQSHRITFKSKCWLEPDEDVPECDSLNQQIAAERIDRAGRRPPFSLDFTYPWTNPQILIDFHSISDVGGGPQAFRISA